MYPHTGPSTPPPLYEPLPPSYEDSRPSLPNSETPAAASPNQPSSPTLSEREIEFFGHRITEHLAVPLVNHSQPPVTTPHPVVPSQAFAAPPRPIVPLQPPPVVPSQAGQISCPQVLGVRTRHAALLDVLDSEDLALPPTPTAQRAVRSTRPRAPKSTPALPADPLDAPEPTEFEILVWSMPPARKPSGRAKKVTKVNPVPYGPVTSDTGTDWESLLELIADLFETDPPFLATQSFQWRWLKPANSPWLPLRTDGAFKSMIKQLRAPAKNVTGEYIIIQMDQPVQKPAGPSRAGHSTPFIDEDEHSDDDDPKRKKPRFDDGLAEIVDELKAKYSIGLCSLHSDKHCFHHRVTNNHFILNDTKLIVWASKIRTGKATLLSPPVGSPQFTSDSAARVVTNTPTPVPQTLTPPPAVPAPPVTPAHFLPPPGPFHPQYTPYHTNPYSYPGSFGYPMAPPGFFPPFMSPGPSHAPDRSAPSDPRSSPPPGSNGSLDEFCAKYSLDESVRRRLEELGFEVGDDLTSVKEVYWERVGFAPLTWDRVLKVYKRYQRFLRDGL